MADYLEYDERAAEIEREFSYDGYQIVRREMFAHLREPAMTIRYDSITFNTACIEGLEDAVYIQIMVSDNQHRIAIRKSKDTDKDALRWCVAKPDKRKSRVIKGKFSTMIYNLMSWTQECKYKILGHKIEFKGETLYVFELDECEIYRERPKRTKEEREARAKSMTQEELKEADRRERKESMTPFSPSEAEETFGLPVNEHQNTIQLESMNQFRDISSLYSNHEGVG